MDLVCNKFWDSILWSMIPVTTTYKENNLEEHAAPSSSSVEKFHLKLLLYLHLTWRVYEAKNNVSRLSLSDDNVHSMKAVYIVILTKILSFIHRDLDWILLHPIPSSTAGEEKDGHKCLRQLLSLFSWIQDKIYSRVTTETFCPSSFSWSSKEKIEKIKKDAAVTSLSSPYISVMQDTTCLIQVTTDQEV